MRARTSVIISLAATLGVVAYRRALPRLVSLVFARSLRKSLALAAYRHSLTRKHISQQDLLKRRSASEEWHTDALLFFGAKKIFPSLQVMVRRGAVVGAGDWHGEVRLGAEQLLERALNDDPEERNL